MEETHKRFNLRVTKDRAAVLLDCDVTDDEFDALVIAIGKELEALGIKDPPDQNQLKEQLHHATEENPHLENFVLIKSEPPVPPQDAKVDWAGDLFGTGLAVDKYTGKINYRKKAATESVTKGTLLGNQIPACEGKDGLNVFGEPIPAGEKPVTKYPEAGDNVRLDTNKNAYYAEINGRVRLINDILSVDEVYIVQEDVDITTGNISHMGAVVVNRDVLNGAKIEAAGSIEVRGIIENAEIRTKGDLTVHGGIRQSEDYKIVVEGGIQAKFIDGGDIQAKEDIVVEKEIINSNIKTLGAVIIPRGHIVGGEIVALRGIYAGHTGSKAYTPTVLVAGEDFNVRNKLSFRKKKIERAEMELEQLRNYADSQMSSQKTAFTSSQDELAKTLLKISKLEKELHDVVDEVKNIEAQTQGSARKLVNVGVALFPKTVICLGNEELTLEEEYAGPIQAEIIDGEIQLNKGERSPDV